MSNHGGRQLDGAVAALRVLPGIAAACPDIPVMIDGGVRRGTDVLKALAFGAKCVSSADRSHTPRSAGARASGTRSRLFAKSTATRDAGVPDLRELGPNGL